MRSVRFFSLVIPVFPQASSRRQCGRRNFRESTRVALGFVGLLALTAVTAEAAVGREQNRSIPNVLDQFLALKHHGEWLGFNMVGFDFGLCGKRHWQGIQRNNNVGIPYLYLTDSQNADDRQFLCGLGGKDAGPGHLVVVQMLSRDRDGERLRSNRLERDKETEDTAPHAFDQITKVIEFPYAHLGGMQLVGNVLAIPLETPGIQSPPLPDGLVVFFDVSDPAFPVQLPYSLPLTHGAGIVGITDLPEGHCLLAVTWGKGDVVEFYKSNGADWSDPAFSFGDEPYYTWTYDELQPPGALWPWSIDNDSSNSQTSADQTLNFIKQDDGKLFLLGMQNRGKLSPVVTLEDVAVLYEVTVLADSIQLSRVDGLHFFTQSPGAGSAINFNAGAGVYISPTQELILYATEHYVNGPNDASVEMAEFRHRDVYRPGSPNYSVVADPDGPYHVPEGSTIPLTSDGSSSAAARPWVELYDQVNGWNPQHAELTSLTLDNGVGSAEWKFSGTVEDPGDSVMVDFVDWNHDDYNDFGKLDGGFHDLASSARWFAGAGCEIFLTEHANGGGKFMNLPPVSPTNLGFHFMCNSSGCIGADNQASSEFFGPACALSPEPTYSWSTDVPDDLGILMNANSPVASFKGIDDAPNRSIDLRVCVQLTCVTASADMDVLNVDPQFGNIVLESQIDENGIAHLQAPYTDLGAKDDHSLMINWGDGTEELLTQAPTGSGIFGLNHRYRDNGPAGVFYPVNLTLTDDDGGTSLRSMSITVLNVAPIVQAGTDQTTTVGTAIGLGPATFTDAGLEDTHTAQIHWGDGAVEAGTVSQGAGSGTVAGTHSYRESGSYTVTVTVTDDDGGMGSGTFNVTVAPAPNLPPTANAGPDQTVRLGSRVTLNGTESSDPDNGPDPLSFRWLQTAGPAAVFFGAGTATPTLIPILKGSYEFKLTVNDGQAASSDEVRIMAPKFGDIDLDGDVDRNDLILILASRNTVANGPNDLRDLNGDRRIDVLDARILVTRCTRSRCAV